MLHSDRAEALTFSAMLRLPRSVGAAEKRAIVDRMLKEESRVSNAESRPATAVTRSRLAVGRLRLENCADTLIGNERMRGVSGGEKKRIGVELVTGPQVLFLDEPTSGLDAFGAWSIANNLVESRGGCTILCTIHQPSSEVFHTFEQVLILNGGSTFYRPAAALPAQLAELLPWPNTNSPTT